MLRQSDGCLYENLGGNMDDDFQSTFDMVNFVAITVRTIRKVTDYIEFINVD